MIQNPVFVEYVKYTAYPLFQVKFYLYLMYSWLKLCVISKRHVNFSATLTFIH